MVFLFRKMDKPVGFGIGSDRCVVNGVVATRDPVENVGRLDERTRVSSRWVVRNAQCR